MDNCGNYEVIDVDTLCDWLNIGVNTAYMMLKNGEIDAIRRQHRWIITKQNVIDYLSKGSTKKEEAMRTAFR